MSNNERFSPVKHVPRFTKHLFVTLGTPLLMYFVLIGNFILSSLIVVFYYFEGGVNPKVQSMFEAFWWGFVTVTTVGYGDIVPVTTEGRIIAMILMVTGVVFFVSFTALLVSFLLAHTEENTDQKILDEIQQVKAEILNLRNQLESKKS